MEGEIRQPFNSIELSRNAKGGHAFVIKCRGDDVEEVKKRLGEWESLLSLAYPVEPTITLKAVKDADNPGSG